ncbi:MAG: glycosyltransferase [Gammaproteobacteria bacterium]|nr:glycosyltransferase [Gammaproteobacteria bacterium]
MKICHIITGLNVGGAELMMKRLILEYKKEKPEQSHVVISLTAVGKVGIMLRNAGIEVYEVNVVSITSLPKALYQLVKIIRRVKPDIVQTWMYHADFLGGLAAKIAGCKNIIWGVRNTDISAYSSKATRFLCYICAFFSHIIPKHIVCVAEAAREKHIAIGYSAKKMRTIRNGFDLSVLNVPDSDVERFREELNISKDKILIGVVARYNSREKDPENFVKAAGLLAKEFPHVCFMMVGRDCDKHNRELTSWIEQTGHAERFLLLGERKDIPLCMAAMDIFCLSSRTEGIPNALGEAMALGKLCVATDVGDARVLVGECGIVVPKENSQALADAVRKLMSLLPQERVVLEEKAHQRIAVEFNMKRACERFDKVYGELLC